jgi:glycosyltransferase involved in cell wall biosynthesis
MNLCIAYPNQFSYSETFIRNQIEALQPQHLIYEGWYPARYASGISFLPFPFSLLPVRGAIRNLIPVYYHRLYTRMLVQFIKRNQIQLLIAEYGPMGATLIDACEQAKIPLVVHFHGFDAYHYQTLATYKEAYLRMFQKAKAVITVSQDMKNQLLSLGAHQENLFCNPYGVHLHTFTGASPQLAAPIFVAVGRFTPKKAPINSLQAFAKVNQLCREARLIMIGEGELWEEAKNWVVQAGLSESVEFTGALPPDKVATVLQTARVFIQHSLRASNGDAEGTPNSVLEASAAGLPIVSTRHAGIKDAVIHGESGFLVEEGDVEGMANFMYLLATDARLAGQMGQRGRQHMEENYTMEKRIQYLKTIIQEAARQA